MKRVQLSLTRSTTDESLRGAALDLIKASGPGVAMYRSHAESLYDQIVAIHEARKAIRRANARKRGAK